MSRIVVGFGCPRAGTTFLKKCLEHLNVFTVKMAEDVRMHPCKSSKGLLHLQSLFRRRLILARIVRHPLEIVESFLAARTMRDKNPGIARNTDREIISYIRNESENVAAQAPLLRVPLVTIKYEEISPDMDIGALAGLPGERAFREALGNFGTKPARLGRLSEGVGRVSTDEERAYFESMLRATMEREGYR